MIKDYFKAECNKKLKPKLCKLTVAEKRKEQVFASTEN